MRELDAVVERIEKSLRRSRLNGNTADGQYKANQAGRAYAYADALGLVRKVQEILAGEDREALPDDPLREAWAESQKDTQGRVSTHSLGVLCGKCEAVLITDNCRCGRPHGFTFQQPSVWAYTTFNHDCFKEASDA